MRRIAEWKKKRIKDFVDAQQIKKPTVKEIHDFCNQINIAYQTYVNYREYYLTTNDMYKEGEGYEERAGIDLPVTEEEKLDIEVDRALNEIKKYFKFIKDPEEMKKITLASLMKKIMEKGDPASCFRAAQIMGWIVEKKEDTLNIKVKADDLAKRLIKARRLNEEWRERKGLGTGVVAVPERPALLPDRVRVDSEPQTQEISKVATLASPGGDGQ